MVFIELLLRNKPLNFKHTLINNEYLLAKKTIISIVFCLFCEYLLSKILYKIEKKEVQKMRPSEIEFNVSDLKPLKMPYRKNNDMAMTVSDKCFCTLNGHLLKEIKKIIPDLKMKFLISDDLKIIFLQKSQDTNFKFLQSGKIKHVEFTKNLEQHGYAIPARYIIEWDESKSAWIGLLQEMPKAPEVKKRRKYEKRSNV